MTRFGILFLVVLAGAWATLPWTPSTESASHPAAVEAPVHQAFGMLQYVWGDYPEAVSEEGAILDAHEFEEQIEVLEAVEELLQEAARREPERSAPHLVQQLDSLRAQVRRAALPAQVQETTAALRLGLQRHYALRLAPERWPVLDNGRQVYVAACLTCHGEQGRSDTEVARNLTPRPTDLQEERLRLTLSAYQVFNLVTFGVPGTSMPCFPTLTEEERWDVAFYVMALRHQGELTSPHSSVHETMALPGLTLTELAQSTDAALLERLRRIGAEPEHRAALLAQLRCTEGVVRP